jgi:hypothetical protein
MGWCSFQRHPPTSAEDMAPDDVPPAPWPPPGPPAAPWPPADLPPPTPGGAQIWGEPEVSPPVVAPRTRRPALPALLWALLVLGVGLVFLFFLAVIAFRL